jgi:hypothetical protein
MKDLTLSKDISPGSVHQYSMIFGDQSNEDLRQIDHAKLLVSDKTINITLVFMQCHSSIPSSTLNFSMDDRELISLATLKELFLTRHHTSPLEAEFQAWDAKIARWRRKIALENSVPHLSIDQKGIKHFIDSLELKLSCSREIFKLARAVIQDGRYPFDLKMQQKNNFLQFMLRYYISEEQIISEFKMFRVEDAFAQKAQNLNKYAGKKSKSKIRIFETWKSLGPVDKMADKVGHSF